MISFIVPAHNERAGLGRTLQAIHDSASVVGQPYEIIVVDDASTDATAEVARQHNATVVSVNHRQIAATRNSGGRAARGDLLFFVDADTTVNPRAVTSAIRRMDNGAAGGGAWTRLEGNVPLYARLLFFILYIGGKIAGFTGGAFMFCTREAFHEVGGFDEGLYAAEEVAMSFALKRAGRFVVLSERVLTSGRRFRTTSGLQVLAAFFGMAFFHSKTLTRRSSSVEKIWYDSNRAGDDKNYASVCVKVSNFIALLILAALVTQPLWIILTTCWPQTLAGPLGTFRRTAGIVTIHVRLFAWPGTIFLTRSLLGQKRWQEGMKLAALIAFCLWQVWVSTQGVIRIWTTLYHWLTHFYNA